MFGRRLLKNGLGLFGRAGLARGLKIDPKLIDVDLTTTEHYERLMINAEYNPKGFLKASSNELVKMLTIVDDFKVCLAALYNFKGQRIPISATLYDSYIKRSIDLGCPELTIDLVDFHQYLDYWPHPETLNAMLSAFVKTPNPAAAQRLLNIFEKRKLLKTSSRVQKTLSELAKQVPQQPIKEASLASPAN